jgi:hypothetical protein
MSHLRGIVAHLCRDQHRLGLALPVLLLTMIIYKCRFTGDEMLSDAFKPSPVLDEDGSEVPGLIQIQSQKVNKVCNDGLRLLPRLR